MKIKTSELEGAAVTDRELLELAARAAGYKVRWHEVWQCFAHKVPHNTDNPPTLSGQRHVWVPLTDDGDALRLAMALGIDIVWCSSGRVITIASAGDRAFEVVESSREDREENTRRAIVRAAAEIGKLVK